MSTSLQDAKLAWLQAALGSTDSEVTDLEFQFFSTYSGLTPVGSYSLNDHKRAFYTARNGLTASETYSLQDLEKYWWETTIGANTYSSFDDIVFDGYLNYPFAG